MLCRHKNIWYTWQQLPQLGNLGKTSSPPGLLTLPGHVQEGSWGGAEAWETEQGKVRSTQTPWWCRASTERVAESQGWCALAEPPDCHRGRKPRACAVLYETCKWQNLCSKEGSISSFPPSQPTPPPGARSDTTPRLTAPPQCAVFQEVIYLPTSIFVRSTCSLKHNENSLPDQFVSEVSWLPAPLWVISFCLHVRTIRLTTA